MKSFFSLVSFTTLACSLAAGAPSVDSVSSSKTGLANVNPYVGYESFNSPVWKPKVLSAAAAFHRQGKHDLARKAREVAKVPTFLWISKSADVPDLPKWLTQARDIQRRTGKKQILQVVVYNLPDRDCSAKASAGEWTYADGGKQKYERYIQTIRSHLARFPDVRVSIQLETDAIGNMVTNLAVPKCGENAAAQKQSYSYAVANLQLPNVALYLDGAHAGWLGWPDNLGPTADILIEIVNGAKAINPKSVVRGVTTDVSNYNGYNDPTLPMGTDELIYINNLAPLLSAKGWDAKFIVDQGRSGNHAIQRPGGEWCNFKHAGFGLRPSTNTSNPHVDAIVWVKPAGESDGTTDQASLRFDATCISNSSIIPMPEAGDWSNTAFEITLKNANPPF